MKDNRSVKRTKKAIKTAFLKILQEKELAKITITDIINVADISRTTFYVHYSNIDTLFNELQEDLKTGLMHLVEPNLISEQLESTEYILIKIAEYFEKHVELSKLVIAAGPTFKIAQIYKDLWSEYINDPNTSNLNIIDRDGFLLFLDFFMHGLCGLMVDWADGKVDKSLTELAYFLTPIISDGFRPYLGNRKLIEEKRKTDQVFKWRA